MGVFMGEEALLKVFLSLEQYVWREVLSIGVNYTSFSDQVYISHP